LLGLNPQRMLFLLEGSHFLLEDKNLPIRILEMAL